MIKGYHVQLILSNQPLHLLLVRLLYNLMVIKAVMLLATLMKVMINPRPIKPSKNLPMKLLKLECLERQFAESLELGPALMAFQGKEFIMALAVHMIIQKFARDLLIMAHIVMVVC